MVELTHYSRGIWCCCCWLWLEGLSPSLHPSLFWVHMFITVFNVHIELVWSMEKYGHPQISKRQIYVRGIILFKRMTLMLPAAMVAGTLCFPPHFWNCTIDYFWKCDRNMQSNKQNASGNKLLQGMIVIFVLFHRIVMISLSSVWIQQCSFILWLLAELSRPSPIITSTKCLLV
jgi:hypothetical protein